VSNYKPPITDQGFTSVDQAVAWARKQSNDREK
jgi:hypothetical protein